MFELAKLVGWLSAPLSLAILLWLLALLLIWRGRRSQGLALGMFAAVGFWVVATPWVANALAYSLERRFPALTADEVPRADAMVVLGGALSGAYPPERPNFDMGAGADRVWYAAELYRAGKAPWVLLSGGNQPSGGRMQPEARAMRSMLLALGVPDSAIVLEGDSRNTLENARESLGLIRTVGARRVLLVTSALHMPRALKTFQAAVQGTGVTVLAATTDVEALPDTLHPLGRWLPDADSLTQSTCALKEYLGLAVLDLRALAAVSRLKSQF